MVHIWLYENYNCKVNMIALNFCGISVLIAQIIVRKGIFVPDITT